MFIDTHCHLDATEFEGAQSDVVRNAQAAGVSRIVVPSVTRANFDIVRALCAQYPDCVPAYGIHPMYVDAATPDDLDVLRDHLRQHRPVAVGEIGLDFFVQHYDRAAQEYFFVEQLKLAREFDLPVLLHLRRAQDVVLKHLRHFYGGGGPSTSLRTGIAHAFNGSRQQADEFIKLGFKLGFGGAMTYPRASKLRELAATLPLDSIVLETDAPDIPPEFLQTNVQASPLSPNSLPCPPLSNLPPHTPPTFGGQSTRAGERANEEGNIQSTGERDEALPRKKIVNEPQYLPRIAQTLAELRGLSPEEVGRATTANAMSVLPGLAAV